MASRVVVASTALPAIAALALVAACGTADPSSAPASDPGVVTTSVAPPGPFFGVCGSLTDEEVRTAFAVPAFGSVVRNSVGCVWNTSGPNEPQVSFSWYRGSPIGRERAGSDRIGRPPQDIEIGGKQGFEATSLGVGGVVALCEIGLQFDADFVHFSVTYAQSPPTADPCDVARSLLTKVVERAK